MRSRAPPSLHSISGRRCTARVFFSKSSKLGMGTLLGLGSTAIHFAFQKGSIMRILLSHARGSKFPLQLVCRTRKRHIHMLPCTLSLSVYSPRDRGHSKSGGLKQSSKVWSFQDRTSTERTGSVSVSEGCCSVCQRGYRVQQTEHLRGPDSFTELL